MRNKVEVFGPNVNESMEGEDRDSLAVWGVSQFRLPQYHLERITKYFDLLERRLNNTRQPSASVKWKIIINNVSHTFQITVFSDE